DRLNRPSVFATGGVSAPFRDRPALRAFWGKGLRRGGWTKTGGAAAMTGLPHHRPWQEPSHVHRSPPRCYRHGPRALRLRSVARRPPRPPCPRLPPPRRPPRPTARPRRGAPVPRPVVRLLRRHRL